jgi:hypothetical protein
MTMATLFDTRASSQGLGTPKDYFFCRQRRFSLGDEGEKSPDVK